MMDDKPTSEDRVNMALRRLEDGPAFGKLAEFAAEEERVRHKQILDAAREVYCSPK